MSKCKRKKIERVIGWKFAQKAMRDARLKREKRRAAQQAKEATAPQGWEHAQA